MENKNNKSYLSNQHNTKELYSDELYQLKKDDNKKSSLMEFDGPFDLLLLLIREKKLNITEISISKVVSNFVEFIKNNKDSGLQISTDFIIIASTLLNIKAEQILQFDEKSPELKKDFDLLFSRLLQYNAFKKLGLFFNEQIMFNELYFPRCFTYINDLLFNTIDNSNKKQIPDIPISKFDFYSLYKQFDIIIKPQISHIRINKVNINNEKKIIKKIITTKKSLTFDELIKDVDNKPNYIIVRFLLILEMFKQQQINLIQKNAFEKLIIENI